MDQDDSMLSTPSSHGDIDESLITIPDEDPSSNQQIAGADRPRTPQNDHLNAAHPGELSPPRSQNQAFTEDTTPDSPVLPNTTSTVSFGTTIRASGAEPSSTVATGAHDGEWRPGAGWKTKKAQDEMTRAWDNFVDRDFSLKEFGDVLADRIGTEPGQQSTNR